MRTLNSVLRRLLGAAGTCATGFAAAQAPTNDAEYARLLDAIRAAEYVRSDFILDATPEPRVFGVLASAAAFIDQNPDATEAQLDLFVQLQDQALSSFDTTDPGLARGSNLLTALRFSRVDHPDLAGLDTDIGVSTVELLGLSIPEAINYDALRLRTANFEIQAGRTLSQSPMMYDILVEGLYQTEPIEDETPATSAVFRSYLATIPDLDPAWQQIRADRPMVNEGLLELPATFAEYQTAAGSVGPGSLQQQLTDEREFLFGQIPVWTQRVVAAEAASPTLMESLDGGVDIAAVEQQFRANLSATTPSRVVTSGVSFLLLQADPADPDGVFDARDFAAVTLETNDALADLELGLSIAGGLTNAGLAIAGGNPFDAASELLPVVSDLLGVGLTPSPTTDDLIIELSQQVADMQVQLNDRFDRVDAQLGLMYGTIVDGFTTVSGQVSAVQTQLARVRTDLRRIESALNDSFTGLFEADLRASANNLLNYRAINGVLPYAGPDNSFVSGSQGFFNFATITAQESVYAGSGSESPLVITIDNADEMLNSGVPYTAMLNDLRATRRVLLGDASFPPEPLAGVEAWAQGASAYARMASQSPWFNAYRQTQANTELADLMLEGQRTVDFLAELRETEPDGSSPLFDVLFDRYEDVLDAIDAEVNTQRTQAAPGVIKRSNGTLFFNPWSSRTQNIEAHIPALGNIVIEDVLPGTLLASSERNKGYRAFVRAGSAGDTDLRRIQVWHFLEREVGGRTDIRVRSRLDRAFQIPTAGVADFWIGAEASSTTASVRRLFEYRGFLNLGSDLLEFNSDVDAWLYFVQRWGETGGDFGTTNCLPERFGRGNDQMMFGAFGCDTGTLLEIFVLNNFNVINTAALNTSIDGHMLTLRRQTGNAIVNQLCNDPSGQNCAQTPSRLEQLAQELEDIESLIEAYITLAAPEAMEQSEALRSALRGIEGTSDLGLRSVDLRNTLRAIVDADFAGRTGPAGTLIEPTGPMRERVAIVKAEIEAALAMPMSAPPYLSWVQAELHDLQANTFNLATGDTYTATGALTVDASAGVLSNDTRQLVIPANPSQEIDAEFLPLFVDPLFDPSDDGFVSPQHGTLTLDADGGFTYTPDAGFVGTDTFTYRAATTIMDGPIEQTIRSSPATVVIRVGGIPCLADVNRDGILNGADFNAWLTAFGNGDPAADQNLDGQLNGADFNQWLQNFAAGCGD